MRWPGGGNNDPAWRLGERLSDGTELFVHPTNQIKGSLWRGMCNNSWPTLSYMKTLTGYEHYQVIVPADRRVGCKYFRWNVPACVSHVL